MGRKILMISSILLALAVILGAFGAHGLKSFVSAEMLQTWKTGVDYHFYHSLGLLFIGIIAFNFPSKYLRWSAILLVTGIVLFSGSLYLLTITEIKMFVAVTPFGGLSFIVGWIVLFVGVWKIEIIR